MDTSGIKFSELRLVAYTNNTNNSFLGKENGSDRC